MTNKESISQTLVDMSQRLVNSGLNKGTSGNISVRTEQGFIVTPSGVEVDDMTADSMVYMQMDGQHSVDKKPSSEWRFHRDILQSRTEINAVIHIHSMFATTLACLHKDVPPFHYMIAVTGGDSIRCAPYALFGSQALSDHALAALKERKACLLANHGMIVLGIDLEEAYAVAVEVENLCEHYWRLLQITPNPPLLTESEMQEVFQQFEGYGRWSN
jgi:L-fuculose-phosphate aldolase